MSSSHPPSGPRLEMSMRVSPGTVGRLEQRLVLAPRVRRKLDPNTARQQVSLPRVRTPSRE
jgi:hypothetical protein